MDGFIARVTHTTSEFGTKLDSIADLVYYAVMLLKVFPILTQRLPMGIWVAVACIIIVRLTAYFVAAVKHKRFASLHTYFNKITGVAVFSVPYFISSRLVIVFSSAVCVIAGAASAEELVIHLINGRYDVNNKSICMRKNKQK